MKWRNMMSAIGSESTKTVKNLLAAYAREYAAYTQYTAFAQRADVDGLHGVASLFRATARAEQIHSNNHAKIIGLLGGEAACEASVIKPKSTLENLETALRGENYEIDTMSNSLQKQKAMMPKLRFVHFTAQWRQKRRTHVCLVMQSIN
jgi:rubrerythrin